MKNALLCLSIVAIVMLCTLNVATASTGNYSTTIHNNARHTGDHIPMARDNKSNGILNWNYVTEGILIPPAIANGIVYVGSVDHNVYALNAATGTKVWNYTTGGWVLSPPPSPTESFTLGAKIITSMHSTRQPGRKYGVT